MVALLDFASLATASTVNLSYPCCCNSRNVTANNSASRAVHRDARDGLVMGVESEDTGNLSSRGGHDRAAALGSTRAI